MHKYTYIPMAAALIIMGACPLDPKNIGTPESTGETMAGTDTSTGTTASPTGTSPGPDDTSTTGGPGDPDSSESGDTDTTTTSEPGDTDTDTDTDTDPGEEGLCGEADPATSASYKVVLDGWPGQSDTDHDVERSCMVDAVSSNGTLVTTMLTCDVDGVPLGAQFEISAAPEGEVDWSVGQAVTLRSFFFMDEFEQVIDLRVTLLDDPAALLVHGQNWWGDNVPTTQMLGPILRERTSSCMVPPLDVESLLFGLTYSLMRGADVSIMSGHRGALPIDPTHSYAIDLAHSGEGQGHGSEHSLIRRVKSG